MQVTLDFVVLQSVTVAEEPEFLVDELPNVRIHVAGYNERGFHASEFFQAVDLVSACDPQLNGFENTNVWLRNLILRRTHTLT